MDWLRELGFPELAVDRSLPPDVIELRDPGSGEVLGRFRLHGGHVEPLPTPTEARHQTPIYVQVCADHGLDPLGLLGSG